MQAGGQLHLLLKICSECSFGRIIHSINLISSAVFIFVIRKEWFVKASRIGAVLIVTGIGLFFAVPEPNIQLLSVIISSIAIGCVNISMLIPFVFLLNNTEKLYTVVGSNVLIQLISLFQEYGSGRSWYNGTDLVLSFVILAISLSATLFFKEKSILSDLDDSNDQMVNAPEIHWRIYLTIFFNCAIVVLCKGAGKGILNIAGRQFRHPDPAMALRRRPYWMCHVYCNIRFC